jgi:hypothetical protein
MIKLKTSDRFFDKKYETAPWLLRLERKNDGQYLSFDIFKCGRLMIDYAVYSLYILKMLLTPSFNIRLRKMVRK